MISAPVSTEQLRELLARYALAPFAEGDRADALRFLEALVEVSFLVSQGDRKLPPSEIQGLVNALNLLAPEAFDRSTLAGMIYEYSAALDRDGLDARLAQVLARFPAQHDRQRLLAFASLVALGDRELQPGERVVLEDMALRMDVPADEVERLISSMLRTLSPAALRPLTLSLPAEPPMRLSSLLPVSLLVLGCGSPPPPEAPRPASASKPAQRARPQRAVAASTDGGSSDGATCEDAINANNDELALGKKQDEDLSHDDLGSVLNQGSYLNDCEVPSSARVSVCVAVKEGRAVGVTVAISPTSPDTERCVAGKVRSLGFPVHQKLHVARTTFELATAPGKAPASRLPRACSGSASARRRGSSPPWC